MLRAILVLVLLAAVIAAGVLGWRLLWRDPGTSHAADPAPSGTAAPTPPGEPVSWTRLTVADTHLRIGYDGSPCQLSNAAVVRETPDHVVVTAYADVRPGACISMAVGYHVDVQLSAPLGSRPVYDGACLSAAGGGALDPACRR